MKMLKLKKGPIIVVLVVCAILLIVGVVFAILPEETYISWGDDNSASSRYYALIICGILDFIMVLIVWSTTVTQKKNINKVNAIVQNIGEDAIALNGVIGNGEAARDNAKKSAFSVFFGMLTLWISGVGFFIIYGRNTNAGYFILYSEGLYIFDMRKKKEIQLNKKSVKDIIITENRNSLVVDIMPANIIFTVNTRGLDISVGDLIAKFKAVFKNAIVNPYKYV